MQLFNKIIPPILLITSLALTGCGGGGGSSDGDSGNTTSTELTSPFCTGSISNLSVPGTTSSKSIAELQSHCYSFTAVAGKTYTITLNTLSGDADLALHQDAELSGMYVIDFSMNFGTEPDILTFVPTSSATYYLEVAGYLSSKYILEITDGTAPTENIKPVANASWSSPAPVLSEVILDGSISSDLNGDSLTYLWTLTNKPTGSAASLSSTSLSTTSFTADVIGNYEFSLVVNDGQFNSDPFTGVIQVTNTSPIASVTWTTPEIVLFDITLDASSSYDVDGHNLTYQWNLSSKPAGSTATLSNIDQVSTSFVPDMVGDYEFTLLVNDGFVASDLITRQFTVTNTQPVAALTNSTTGTIGQTTILDGSSSSDADGHTLLYHWKLLTKPASSNLSFVAQSLAKIGFEADVYGDYTFELVVDDTVEKSLPETITISVNHKFTALSTRITDAEYSETLERLVFVSADSKGLYTFDPINDTVTELTLPLTPTSISVSPDGLYAAVGYNGWASYINLTTNTIIKTFVVTADVLDIVLDGNGYVHAFPRIDQWVNIHSINIATEVETLSTGGSIRAGTLARLHPNGTSIYGADNGLSPADIEKYDISTGTANFLYDSPYHGDYSMCGNLWISEDGLRIFTRCGNVFRSSSDPAMDMTYNGALENFAGQLVSLNHSSEIGKMAAIIQKTGFESDPLFDTNIHFYNYNYLTFEETLQLPDFTVGTDGFVSHGKFIFYNSDGTQYITVVQADSTSGLLNDYAIITSQKMGDVTGNNKTPVAVAGTNQATITGNTVTLDASESYDADGDTLSYTWEIISAPPGSNASLVYPSSVTPEFTPDLTGEYLFGLTVSDSSLTSIQDTILLKSVNAADEFLLQVDFNISDAEFSDALESIVMVSSVKKQLYIFDTMSYQLTKLDLPLAPTAVSISPDGLFAAVGHNGWVTYVDLSLNSISKTFAVTADVLDIILDGKGYVHAFPRIDQWVNIHSINIATEVETLSTGGSIRAGTLARLHPDGNSIYGADNGLSPSDIEKYDITKSTVSYLYDSPYHGDYAMCGNLWISEDGLRIFTRCGNVFRSSTDVAIDMTYNGMLEGFSGQLASLSHSGETGQVAAIIKKTGFSSDPLFDTNIHFYNYEFLTTAGTVALPQFTVGGNLYPSHGKFVFYNSSGTRYFTIVKADDSSATLEDYGISVH